MTHQVTGMPLEEYPTKSYTIDLVSTMAGRWGWSLYDNGGSNKLDQGYADSVEAASDAARMAMLVEHRRAPR